MKPILVEDKLHERLKKAAEDRGCMLSRLTSKWLLERLMEEDTIEADQRKKSA